MGMAVRVCAAPQSTDLSPNRYALVSWFGRTASLRADRRQRLEAKAPDPCCTGAIKDACAL